MRLVPARALAAAAWVLVGAIFACRHFQPQPPPAINDGKPRLALHVAGPRGYERLSDHHLPLSSAAKFKFEVNLPKG